MARAIVIGCLVGLVAVARAEDPLSDEHARSSTTLYLASAWSPGPTVPIRIGADGALRIHQWHIALEARLGIGGAGSLTGFGMQVAGHVGASLGVAVAAGERVVLSPMFAYDAFAIWEKGDGTSLVHYVTIEVPVSIILRRGVVLEPFAQVGIARYQGATDPVFVIGPRIGIIL